MSKITKFIFSPKLFLEDMILNSLNAKRVNTKKIKKTSISYEQDDNYEEVIHLIHSGEGLVNGKAHLLLWLNLFELSRENFAVMVRNYDLYLWGKNNHPSIKFIFSRSAIDVEEIMKLLFNVKAIYYLSNTGNLIHTLRFNVYQHVFLGHGDSDKAASAHKFFRVYDEIWVSGQAHIDRFINTNIKINNVEFVKIGRPSLKEYFTSQQDQKINTTNLAERIVYLPTWEGSFVENDYSSVRDSLEFLPSIQNKTNCQLIVKYHPSTGTRDLEINELKQTFLEEYVANNNSFEFIEQSETLDSLVLRGDAFICDISAVVSECIPTLKPIFIYIPENKNIVISASNLKYSDYAYVFRNSEELEKQVYDVLVLGKDILKQDRIKALNYLIGVKETLNDEFNIQLKRMRSNEFLGKEIMQRIAF